MSIIANGTKMYEINARGTNMTRVNASGTRVYEKVHKAINGNSTYGRFVYFGQQEYVSGGAISGIHLKRSSGDNYAMGFPTFIYEPSSNGRVVYDAGGFVFTLDGNGLGQRTNRIVEKIEFDVWPTFENNDHTETPVNGWTYRDQCYIQYGFAKIDGILPDIQIFGSDRITFQVYEGYINTSDKKHIVWDTGGINSNDYPKFFVGISSPDYKSGAYLTSRDNIYMWIGNMYIWYSN